MILNIDKEKQKNTITVNHKGQKEKYSFNLLACDSPTCTCGIVYINFYTHFNKNEVYTNPKYMIGIDINEKKIHHEWIKNATKENLSFAESFFEEITTEDLKNIKKFYLNYKLEMTEKADMSAIESDFEFHEVEKNGLMYCYNDVLPFSEQYSFDIENEKYIIFDQYCVLEHCKCTDVCLSIHKSIEEEELSDAVCSVSLSYDKKNWKFIDGHSAPSSIGEIRSKIEANYPDIYVKFRKRHMDLKKIYASNKKKHFIPPKPIQSAKVGRNDPCPCGSGKKYKKCCL